MNHEECRDERGIMMFDHGSGVCSKCMTVLLNEDIEQIQHEAERKGAEEMREQIAAWSEGYHRQADDCGDRKVLKLDPSDIRAVPLPGG